MAVRSHNLRVVKRPLFQFLPSIRSLDDAPFANSFEKARSAADLGRGAPLAPRRGMVRPLRINIPGAIYHVMSRGNARQEIFLDDDDRRHFLKRLAGVVRRFGVCCHAYCLMPNHFHLILRIAEPPLGCTMQQLNSAYAGWFNARHQRIGHVFQGRPKALIIDDGGYFRRALRYVIRNPVRAGLCARCADWEWSSYRETAGLATPASWLAVEDIWAAFHEDADAACRAYAEYCQEADFTEADPAPNGPLVFGSAACRTSLSGVLAPYRSRREFVHAERFADRPPLAEVFAAADTGSRRQEATRRAFDDHGYTLREIGEFLGIAPATVWRHARGVATKWKPRRTKRKDRDLTL